jgi:hypothetical protein
MSYIIINKKKYIIKQFGFKGGNNQGYIDYDKKKIGKIIYLSDKRKKDKTLDTDGYNENPYREIEVHNECNKLIKDKITKNLVKFYKYYVYNNSIILIIDKYDGDLNSIINNLTLNELWSIFHQIIITFIILQDKLEFYQGDFGLSNILYKKVNKTKKYFDYNYNGMKYRIPNEGYEIAICDYGNVIINKFILSDNEIDYYKENLKKRIELYEILLLLSKYIKNEEINNIIYKNIRFNLFNGIYSINVKYTNPADPDNILKVFKGIHK